jgi:hypothetical protein
MNIGDLVTIRNHPEHVGVITDLNKEDGTGWIAVLWFNNDEGFSEFKIPLSSAHHIEVVK